MTGVYDNAFSPIGGWQKHKSCRGGGRYWASAFLHLMFFFVKFKLQACKPEGRGVAWCAIILNLKMLEPCLRDLLSVLVFRMFFVCTEALEGTGGWWQRACDCAIREV